MSFGSQGYEPIDLPRPSRASVLLAEIPKNCDLSLLRVEASEVLNDHHKAGFLNAYSEATKAPRDYRGLTEKVLDEAVRWGYLAETERSVDLSANFEIIWKNQDGSIAATCLEGYFELFLEAIENCTVTRVPIYE